MPSREHRPQGINAAFKRRLADSLINYAQAAETGRALARLDADTESLRGVRFAAELAAGRMHNPHSPTCACPCAKPDPTAVPTPDSPTLAEMMDLARVLTREGVPRSRAKEITLAILGAGFRRVPDALMPGSDPPKDGAHYRVGVPAYLAEVDATLRVPCWECDVWHTYPADGLAAGDRVFLAAACSPEMWVGDFLAVVQAVRFNPRWERRGRITSMYRRIAGPYP